MRSSAARDERAERRRLGDEHAAVVEGAAAHEAQSVRVAARTTRGRAGVVPHVQRRHLRARRLGRVAAVGLSGGVGSTSASPSVGGLRLARERLGGGRVVGVDLARRDRLPRHVGERDREPAQHELVGVLGDRQHRAVAGAAEHRARDTGERRRDPGDLVLDLLGRGEVEVLAQAVGQLHRDPPVGHRRAVGRDLAGDALDPTLDVGDAAVLLAPRGDGQEDVGLRAARRRGRCRPRSRSGPRRRPERRAWRQGSRPSDRHRAARACRASRPRRPAGCRDRRGPARSAPRPTAPRTSPARPRA